MLYHFICLIELFFDKEDITILPLNENYNKIEVTNDILSKNYDLCVITHLFGQDLDTSELYKLKKNNSNCIFIEDRVQGGSFKKI